MIGEHYPRVAILASGGGTTAEAFIKATQEGGVVDAEVGMVITNNIPEKAGVYQLVGNLNRQYGLDIPVLKVNGVTHPGGAGERGEQTLEESAVIALMVEEAGITLVATMGYMKKIRGDLYIGYGSLPNHSSIYESHILNTHPGPLPETKGLYGIGVQEYVLETNLPYSAHTTHAVSKEYDTGLVYASRKIWVNHGETAQQLFDRVQEVEKRELPRDIDRFLKEQKDFNRARARK
jgi:folate-dependent phosphoribosylglycinamide formyltransferase PurN